MRMRTLITSTVAGLLILSTNSFALSYRITDLGALLATNDNSVAVSINNSGQVAGYRYNDSRQQAVVWGAGGVTALDSLLGGSSSSMATGINNHGQVSGWSSSLYGDRAFMWSQSSGTEVVGNLIGAQGSVSAGNALNDAGQVVGYARMMIGNGPAFIWDATSGMQGIGHLPGGAMGGLFNFSNATSINSAGQVVGYSEAQIGSIQTFRAFLWSEGVMQDLGDLSPIEVSYTRASGINDQGQVVGLSALTSVNGISHEHGFIWDASNGMQDLGVLDTCSDSYAQGINEHGQVVGMCSGTSAIAFLWEDGEMMDLNSLIDPSDSLFGAFSLTDALAINDGGQIVGYGTIGGVNHAFLLNPISEPSSIALLVLALVGIVTSRRVRLSI